MRDQRAQASATWASATCRLAPLSSSTRWATKLCATSSWLRLRLAWAIDTWACACLISACCKMSSSCTSTWPLRTRRAVGKADARFTRPATSGRNITLWRERKVPTDCASSCRRARSALTTSTPAARGRPAPPGAGAASRRAGTRRARSSPPLISIGPCGRDWYHHAPADAGAIPTTATTE